MALHPATSGSPLQRSASSGALSRASSVASGPSSPTAAEGQQQPQVDMAREWRRTKASRQWRSICEQARRAARSEAMSEAKLMMLDPHESLPAATIAEVNTRAQVNALRTLVALVKIRRPAVTLGEFQSAADCLTSTLRKVNSNSGWFRKALGRIMHSARLIQRACRLHLAWKREVAAAAVTAWRADDVIRLQNEEYSYQDEYVDDDDKLRCASMVVRQLMQQFAKRWRSWRKDRARRQQMIRDHCGRLAMGRLARETVQGFSPVTLSAAPPLWRPSEQAGPSPSSLTAGAGARALPAAPSGSLSRRKTASFQHGASQLDPTIAFALRRRTTQGPPRSASQSGTLSRGRLSTPHSVSGRLRAGRESPSGSSPGLVPAPPPVLPPPDRPRRSGSAAAPPSPPAVTLGGDSQRALADRRSPSPGALEVPRVLSMASINQEGTSTPVRVARGSPSSSHPRVGEVQAWEAVVALCCEPVPPGRGVRWPRIAVARLRKEHWAQQRQKTQQRASVAAAALVDAARELENRDTDEISAGSSPLTAGMRRASARRSIVGFLSGSTRKSRRSVSGLRANDSSRGSLSPDPGEGSLRRRTVPVRRGSSSQADKKGARPPLPLSGGGHGQSPTGSQASLKSHSSAGTRTPDRLGSDDAAAIAAANAVPDEIAGYAFPVSPQRTARTSSSFDRVSNPVRGDDQGGAREGAAVQSQEPAQGRPAAGPAAATLNVAEEDLGKTVPAAAMFPRVSSAGPGCFPDTAAALAAAALCCTALGAADGGDRPAVPRLSLPAGDIPPGSTRRTGSQHLSSAELPLAPERPRPHTARGAAEEGGGLRSRPSTGRGQGSGGGGGPVSARNRALCCGLPHWLACGLSDETLRRRSDALARTAPIDQEPVRRPNPLPPVPPAPPSPQGRRGKVWAQRKPRGSKADAQPGAAALQLAPPQPRGAAAVAIDLAVGRRSVRLGRALAPFPFTEQDRVRAQAFARRALLQGLPGAEQDNKFTACARLGTHGSRRQKHGGRLVVPRAAGGGSCSPVKRRRFVGPSGSGADAAAPAALSDPGTAAGRRDMISTLLVAKG